MMIPKVQVWWASIDTAAIDRVSMTLSTDERSRADRFHRQIDRDRYVVGRGLLRSVLGRTLNLSPVDVQIRTSEAGKPVVDGITFSVSHSGNLVLVAVAPEPIGVDIEQVRTDLPILDLAATWFPPEDAAMLRQWTGQDRVAWFFRFWTRREAFGKLRGRGLAEPVRFSLTAHPPGARFHDLSVNNGYVASLCVTGDPVVGPFERWTGWP